MRLHDIDLSSSEIQAFCRRWHIRRLAVFGSILRDDCRDESDVDLLADFEEDAPWGLLDQVRMDSELEQLFGRPAHVVSAYGLAQSSNEIIQRAILDTAETVYAT